MYPTSDSRHFAPVLWLLTGVFVFRVLAQLLLSVGPIPGLPSFEQWYSGNIHYTHLVASQLFIVGLLLSQSIQFTKGFILPNKRVGCFLWVTGLVYLTTMLLRLTLGLTVLSDSRWFSSAIPAIFHITLSCFVLLVAAFHRQKNLPLLELINRYISLILPWIIYPAIMALSLYAHFVMAYVWQFGLVPAIYLPVVTGGVCIALLEYVLPHRKEWHPNKVDITNDGLYMSIVQVLLPKIVTAAFIFLIIAPVQFFPASPAILWPHSLPVWQQAILMTLIADFLRYWLHRLAHNNPYLWRLHAVHHAPSKLYWLNVARFHPLEKAIQMLFDALPFILLGVSPYVIGIYFVFYSINGFFQHSNIRLNFGWLNYLISSAHLHRWHHSKITHESNNNYGNNLIVWDLLFGTYFLPKERETNELGLGKPYYPTDFIRQMSAPFSKHANQ